MSSNEGIHFLKQCAFQPFTIKLLTGCVLQSNQYLLDRKAEGEAAGKKMV